MKITDKQLAQWCSTQRSNYNRTPRSISERHIKLLEAIPGWYWNKYDSEFERGVEAYKKYGNQPQRYVTPEGFKLGMWIASCRQQLKDNPERVKVLDSLPGWTWDARESLWMQRWQESMKLGVVGAKSKEHPSLGAWQSHNRLTCKDKKKRKLLEQIPGWTWDGKTRMVANTVALMKIKTKKTFEQGIKYTKKYGLVPQKFVTPDGYKLGVWQQNQRMRCKNGKNPEQKKVLESIPGWKWKLDTKVRYDMSGKKARRK